MTTRLLEVHLENLGKQSFLQSIVSALGGTAAYAPHRFVARSPDGEPGEAGIVLASSTFPVLRFLDPQALTELQQNEEVVRQLEKLGRDLESAGWSRREEMGQHWWSRTYQAE